MKHYKKKPDWYVTVRVLVHQDGTYEELKEHEYKLLKAQKAIYKIDIKDNPHHDYWEEDILKYNHYGSAKKTTKLTKTTTYFYRSKEQLRLF